MSLCPQIASLSNLGLNLLGTHLSSTGADVLAFSKKSLDLPASHSHIQVLILSIIPHSADKTVLKGYPIVDITERESLIMEGRK